MQKVDSAKKAALESLVAAGVKLVAGDLQSGVEALTAIVRGFDVVVSAGLDSLIGSTELNLIDACKAAGVRVFIQNQFGFDYSVPNMELGLLGDRIGVKEDVALKLIQSGQGYLIIANGLFSEWAFSPFTGVDVAQGVVSAPYSFDTRLTVTTLDTIGRSVAELVVQRAINQRVYLASDTVTWEQITAAAEAATGKVDPISHTLALRQHTALQCTKASHLRSVRPVDCVQRFKRVVQSRAEMEQKIEADPADLASRFRIWFGEELGMHWDADSSWNNTHGIGRTDIAHTAKQVLAATQ